MEIKYDKDLVTLGTIIDVLKQLPQYATVSQGFGEPNSYRGDYFDLAFEPVENAKISDMLAYAESAVDKEFEGYKGGEFMMDVDTDCWIATYGVTSDNKIGSFVLDTWIKECGL